MVAIAIFPRWVRLYFDKSLPDPHGLLEGAGAKVRSVTLKAASDLDNKDLRALIKAAVAHSGVTFPRTGATRMIIKSGSKKRRPSRSPAGDARSFGGRLRSPMAATGWVRVPWLRRPAPGQIAMQ